MTNLYSKVSKQNHKASLAFSKLEKDNITSQYNLAILMQEKQIKDKNQLRLIKEQNESKIENVKKEYGKKIKNLKIKEKKAIKNDYCKEVQLLQYENNIQWMKTKLQKLQKNNNSQQQIIELLGSELAISLDILASKEQEVRNLKKNMNKQEKNLIKESKIWNLQNKIRELEDSLQIFQTQNLTMEKELNFKNKKEIKYKETINHLSQEVKELTEILEVKEIKYKNTMIKLNKEIQDLKLAKKGGFWNLFQ